MRVEVKRLFWIEQAGLSFPKDPKLHELAVAFCREFINDPQPNLRELREVWVAVQMDGGEPIEVLSIAGSQVALDVPLFRTKPGVFAKKATHKLIDRMRSFYQDNGLGGQLALVNALGEKDPTQRCPAAEEVLKQVNAEPANRWLVKI